MKIASSNFFAKNLEKPYFPKDTPNYGKAYHKALTYANASDFVVKKLKVRQENFSNKSQAWPIMS